MHSVCDHIVFKPIHNINESTNLDIGGVVSKSWLLCNFVEKYFFVIQHSYEEIMLVFFIFYHNSYYYWLKNLEKSIGGQILDHQFRGMELWKIATWIYWWPSSVEHIHLIFSDQINWRHDQKNIENWITRKLNRSNYSAWSLPIFFLDCLQKLFWEKNLFFDREMSVNCSAPTKTNTNVVPFIGAYSLISVMIFSLSHFQAKSVHVTFVYTTLDTNFYSQLHQPIFFHFFMCTFIFSHLSNRCNCNLFDVCECFLWLPLELYIYFLYAQ